MARTSIIIIMYTRYISENRYEVCLHVCVLYVCACVCAFVVAVACDYVASIVRVNIWH